MLSQREAVQALSQQEAVQVPSRREEVALSSEADPWAVVEALPMVWLQVRGLSLELLLPAQMPTLVWVAPALEQIALPLEAQASVKTVRPYRGLADPELRVF